ncbi:MarR family transcriptional regulator [Corynebacterium hindlerae]|uniref:MarR family transcriptional regulator n=1 Tax=Corynebacterium hindlerae TaxID=699041 RepID=A0A7G5FCW9_9CORY|nr:MarR family transcriptional regulator [Corynebacterium hindlerae]QMV84460.1 MarR family transcriptional regulator [Corynebacterium hindlerae]
MTTSIDAVDLPRQNWDKKGWTAASLGMATVTSLVRLGSLLDAHVNQVLKPYGITFSRFELLTLLMFSRTGALPMKKASSRLNIPPASITHMVSALEQAGLVERSPDPRDGRGVLVSITDQGIALVSSATPALNRFFTSLDISSEALLEESSALRRQLGDG